MANQNSSSDVKRSCSSDSSERSSILDALFSDLAEQNHKEEAPIRRPSRRTPSSIKRSLLKRKSWADCDWEVMEQECFSEYYSSEEESEQEDMDKRIPLFDDCLSDENDKGGDSAATDSAAAPENATIAKHTRPLTRRGSLHEVILNEDSPVISGCARPKLRRRGTMEEMQDGQQQPPHFSRPLVLEIKGKSEYKI
jgi:hypothetical protein